MNRATDEKNCDHKNHSDHRDLWKPLILISVIILVLLIGFFYGFEQTLGSTREWIQSLGIWAPLGFMIIYVGAVVAALPGTILGVFAGAIFGAVYGVIIVSIASTISAAIAFLIARYLARDAVARWLSKHERFKRLDMLTEKQGALVVGVARLIPLFPYNVLNYAFGLTKVSFRTYLFWSWLCMLPGTIIVVVGSDVIVESFLSGEIPWVYLIVVALTVVFVLLITLYLRKTIGTLKK